MRTELLIIDPQVDFCDPNGSLFVQGAVEDMQRLSKFIDAFSRKLDDISVTLDSHHLNDVAHPSFWRGTDGKAPDPFTIISHQDVVDGVWTPALPSLFNKMKEYTKTLEDGGRYPLCIWPPHCLIGSAGHNVVPELFDSLKKWEADRFGMVNYVTKGSNIFTEHYSAVKAEVPDAEDPTTQLNTRLINQLLQVDVLYVAGEAGSHCLANTVRDIVEAFNDESAISKIHLLKDATSPVPTFEQLQDDFITEMQGRGMVVETIDDLLAMTA